MEGGGIGVVHVGRAPVDGPGVLLLALGGPPETVVGELHLVDGRVGARRRVGLRVTGHRLAPARFVVGVQDGPDGRIGPARRLRTPGS